MKKSVKIGFVVLGALGAAHVAWLLFPIGALLGLCWEVHHETVTDAVVVGRTWTRTLEVERWWSASSAAGRLPLHHSPDHRSTTHHHSIGGWRPTTPRVTHGAGSQPRVWPEEPPLCATLEVGCERVRSRTEALWLQLDPAGPGCRADEELWERAGVGTHVRVHTSVLDRWCEGA